MAETQFNPLDVRQAAIRKNVPTPTLWLFGKTGSGKTSIIRYLTGATDAEIGNGFRPQTQFSRCFDFPDAEIPLARFLDTRGIGESGYDPTDDLEQFDARANLMIVTVRAMDQAVDDVLKPLRLFRKSNPRRPVLLVLTRLHDAYPGQQHPHNEEVCLLRAENGSSVSVSFQSNDLNRSLSAQLERFDGLFDRAIAIDLTPPDEGFDQPHFGGQHLRDVILELLPATYRQSLLQLDELNQSFVTEHNRKVAPLILAHSVFAATAAAVPLPWADIPLVLGIQSRLAYKIAKLNQQSLNAKTIAQVSAAMGGRVAIQMGIRESLKFIPWIGIATNVAATFAFTFAAGWAWNWYFIQVKAGHLPTDAELRAVYHEQLKLGESFWKASAEKNST